VTVTGSPEDLIVAACPDVRDCVFVTPEVGGRRVADVLVMLHHDADPDPDDRATAIRSALSAAAGPALRRVLVITDDRLILGPAGEVDRDLMRARHLAEVVGTCLPGDALPPERIPVATERVSVPFAGAGSGVADMAWGQRDIWRAMVHQRSWFPIGGRKPLDPGTTVQDVADELAYLLARFPSMRTKLRQDADGKVRQHLFASGRIDLEIHDADGEDADKVAATVELHYRHQYFDFAAQWPVRMAVVRQHGALTHMVVLMHHMATDAFGAQAMLRDVAARDTAPVRGQQMLEQARWQASPAGRRQNDRALRYFEGILRVIPPHRFPDPIDPRRPRFWIAEYESRALRMALTALTRRTGVDGTPVVVALFAIAMARVTGIDPVVVRPIVGNRFRRQLAETVCHTAQSSLIALDVADVTVDEVVDRAHRQGLAALKHAYHDPDDAADLIARVIHERGDGLDIGCFINDRRAEQPPIADLPEVLPAVLRAAREDSVFRFLGQQDDEYERLLVNIDADSDTVRLGIEWDTHSMPPHYIEQLASAMEAAAVEAALDPAAMTGVGGHGHVHTTAGEDL
jgi:hypothetical protein